MLNALLICNAWAVRTATRLHYGMLLDCLLVVASTSLHAFNKGSGESFTRLSMSQTRVTSFGSPIAAKMHSRLCLHGVGRTTSWCWCKGVLQ